MTPTREGGTTASEAGRFRLRLPRGRELAVGERTLIMGILNVTPDSFSDGGHFFDREAAIAQVERMLDEGADILDVGGESTRPGSESVPPEEQVRRTSPVIAEIRRRSDIPVSIDTNSAEVARRAFDEGADILNDITALRGDVALGGLAAERGAPVVLMHMRGTPRTMQEAPRYGDVVADISAFFVERIACAESMGLSREQTILDPGFGFGKTLAHNLDLLRRLDEFHALGRPLLVGPSRKAMVGAVLHRPVEERLMGTAAAVAACVARGARIVRVHDVAAMRDVARMTEAIEGGGR